MKTLFALLATLAIPAFGDANMTCATVPHTTSIVVFTEKGQTTIRVIHHNGVRTMPVSKGIVTLSDLARLQKKAEKLEQLGSQYDIRLDSARCQSNYSLIDCYGAIDQTINGHHLTWVELDNTKAFVSSSIAHGGRNVITMNLSFRMDGEDYDFSSTYEARDCVDNSGPALQ